MSSTRSQQAIGAVRTECSACWIFVPLGQVRKTFPIFVFHWYMQACMDQTKSFKKSKQKMPWRSSLPPHWLKQTCNLGHLWQNFGSYQTSKFLSHMEGDLFLGNEPGPYCCLHSVMWLKLLWESCEIVNSASRFQTKPGHFKMVGESARETTRPGNRGDNQGWWVGEQIFYLLLTCFRYLDRYLL